MRKTVKYRLSSPRNPSFCWGECIESTCSPDQVPYPAKSNLSASMHQRLPAHRCRFSTANERQWTRMPCNSSEPNGPAEALLANRNPQLPMVAHVFMGIFRISKEWVHWAHVQGFHCYCSGVRPKGTRPPSPLASGLLHFVARRHLRALRFVAFIRGLKVRGLDSDFRIRTRGAAPVRLGMPFSKTR